MGVYRLMFRRHIPARVRLQAFANLVCTLYMTMMTLGVTHISFFYIVPECYYGDTYVIFKSRLLIWYIFTAVVGNYITCAFTDTGVRTKAEDQIANGSKSDSHVTSDSEIRQRRKDDTGSSKPPGRNTRFCLVCNSNVSARTHHCYLCEQCIVKRDHHCFFMGVCVGKENHIYFIFFTLFMGFGTFYGLLLVAKYMYFLYGVQFEGPQTFISLFLNTIHSLLQGEIPSIRYLALFVFLYVSLAGTMVSFGFFSWQMLNVFKGQTAYEARHGISRYSKGGYLNNFQAVFNTRSLISLLVPFWDLVTDTNYCRISSDDVKPRKSRQRTNKTKAK